jgi:hypothetical protein
MGWWHNIEVGGWALLAIPVLPNHLECSPLALYKQKYSTLMGSASVSTPPSPSSIPALSRKRSHISEPPAPALDPDIVALGGHIDSFIDAFHVATGTAPTNMEVSPVVPFDLHRK